MSLRSELLPSISSRHPSLKRTPSFGPELQQPSSLVSLHSSASSDVKSQQGSSLRQGYRSENTAHLYVNLRNNAQLYVISSPDMDLFVGFCAATTATAPPVITTTGSTLPDTKSSDADMEDKKEAGHPLTVKPHHLFGKIPLHWFVSLTTNCFQEQLIHLQHLIWHQVNSIRITSNRHLSSDLQTDRTHPILQL